MVDECISKYVVTLHEGNVQHLLAKLHEIQAKIRVLGQ
jgi:hypothetical protein